MSRNFKNIKAWKHSDDLVVDIYSVTKFFPKEELYGLVSQLRRAAVSVPTNIVEGSGREHKKEYLHFLYIARGSLSEVIYLIHISKRLGYIEDIPFVKLNDLAEEVAKTLYGLILAIKKETNFISIIIAVTTSSLILYGGNLFNLRSQA